MFFLQNPVIIGSMLQVECILFALWSVGLDFLKSPYPEIHGVDLWQVYDQDLYTLDTRNKTVNK